MWTPSQQECRRGKRRTRAYLTRRHVRSGLLDLLQRPIRFFQEPLHRKLAYLPLLPSFIQLHFQFTTPNIQQIPFRDRGRKAVAGSKVSRLLLPGLLCVIRTDMRRGSCGDGTSTPKRSRCHRLVRRILRHLCDIVHNVFWRIYGRDQRGGVKPLTEFRKPAGTRSTVRAVHLRESLA